MVDKQLVLLNKRVDILFRLNRGDTKTAIAEHYKVCRYVVTRHITQGRKDQRVIDGARLKQEKVDNDY